MFDININDVKPYADAAGNVTVKAWNHAREVHEEKLAKARQTKEYQFWCANDEEDIDAEKIISDIKNLKDEVYFNVVFSEEIDYLAADKKTAAEQKVSQRKLESTFRSTLDKKGLYDVSPERAPKETYSTAKSLKKFKMRL